MPCGMGGLGMGTGMAFGRDGIGVDGRGEVRRWVADAGVIGSNSKESG